MEHHADGAIAALGERAPRLLEPLEREVVRDQACHVDLALGEELERAARDALRVREGAEDVEVPAHDRREIHAGELDARSGGASQDRATAAACESDRIARRVGRPGELNDQVRGPVESRYVRGVDDLVGHVADTGQALASAHERDPPGAKCPRELRRAEADRAGADDHDVLSRGEPTALDRPERDAEVVGPRPLIERYVLGGLVPRRDWDGGVVGKTAVDREADVRMPGLALSVVEAEGVHPFAAALAR